MNVVKPQNGVLFWGFSRKDFCAADQKNVPQHTHSSPLIFHAMYTFIKSALVLLLLAVAAVYPGVQAKPAGPSVQVEAPENVVDVWLQQLPGTTHVRAIWQVQPPGDDSLVTFIDLNTQQATQFTTQNLSAMFYNLTVGHTYHISVAHGQDMKFTTIVVQ